MLTRIPVTREGNTSSIIATTAAIASGLEMAANAAMSAHARPRGGRNTLPIQDRFHVRRRATRVGRHSAANLPARPRWQPRANYLARQPRRSLGYKAADNRR